MRHLKEVPLPLYKMTPYLSDQVFNIFKGILQTEIHIPLFHPPIHPPIWSRDKNLHFEPQSLIKSSHQSPCTPSMMVMRRTISEQALAMNSFKLLREELANQFIL